VVPNVLRGYPEGLQLMNVKLDVLQVALHVCGSILPDDEKIKIVVVNWFVWFDSPLVGDNIAEELVPLWQ
jgi:hypothetical protein